MEVLEIVLLILSSGLVVSLFTNLWQYWTTKKFSSEERIYQRIYDTFILNGLYPIEAAISQYGNAVTLAFADLRPAVMDSFGKQNMKNLIKPVLDEIRRRELVADLISRNYRIAGKRFPRLQVFGMELYNAAKRTIDAYSRFLRDNLQIDVFMKQVKEAISKGQNVDWLLERIKAAALILQQTQVYMERRLRQLDDYLYKKGYHDYSEFIRLKDDINMKRLREEFKEYLARHGRFLAHTTEETSLELSKWLNERFTVTL